MSYYNTQTTTFTVTDIRKTFESFLADLKMIARRTNTYSQEYINEIYHDVIKLAEHKYLEKVDVVLLDSEQSPLKAASFSVNNNGKLMSGDRAGGNNWQEIPENSLTVILSYREEWKKLTNAEKENFRKTNSFKINWVKSNIDTRYSHLSPELTKTYASKGYELNRTNYN